MILLQDLLERLGKKESKAQNKDTIEIDISGPPRRIDEEGEYIGEAPSQQEIDIWREKFNKDLQAINVLKCIEEYIEENYYNLVYTNNRELILNSNFILAKPDFDSENDLFIDYIIKNPNQKLTIQIIEKGIGRKLTKPLTKILENLGVNKELRTLFVDVSKTSIYFRNPVSLSKAQELGVSKFKISV